MRSHAHDPCSPFLLVRALQVSGAGGLRSRGPVAPVEVEGGAAEMEPASTAARLDTSPATALAPAEEEEEEGVPAAATGGRARHACCLPAQEQTHLAASSYHLALTLFSFPAPWCLSALAARGGGATRPRGHVALRGTAAPALAHRPGARPLPAPALPAPPGTEASTGSQLQRKQQQYHHSCPARCCLPGLKGVVGPLCSIHRTRPYSLHFSLLL
jgi:hypothetical protein